MPRNVAIDSVLHRVLKFCSAETSRSIVDMTNQAIEAHLTSHLGEELYATLRKRAIAIEEQREEQRVA